MLRAREDLARRRLCIGRDDDLDKDLRDRLGGRRVEPAVDRDDAAKGADRVAGQRRVPGLAQIRAERGAARVGVLDDRDRRLGEFGDQLEGGVGVAVIVVGQLLALHQPRARDPGAVLVGAIERRSLVRVLAIAGLCGEPAGDDQRLGKGDPFLAGEPRRDRRIVGGGQRIGLLRQPAPHREPDPARMSSISSSSES